MQRATRGRETRQRRLIYEILRGTTSHPTAEWVYERAREELPKISLGTVYRNLGVLKAEGLVRELRGVDRRARFDADLSPHAHFICERCGAIRDVTPVPQVEWESLRQLVGCEVTRQEIEFWGLCPACRRASSS